MKAKSTDELTRPAWNEFAVFEDSRVARIRHSGAVPVCLVVPDTANGGQPLLESVYDGCCRAAEYPYGGNIEGGWPDGPGRQSALPWLSEMFDSNLAWAPLNSTQQEERTPVGRSPKASTERKVWAWTEKVGTIGTAWGARLSATGPSGPPITSLPRSAVAITTGSTDTRNRPVTPVHRRAVRSGSEHTGKETPGTSTRHSSTRILGPARHEYATTPSVLTR